jgi:hypothetical protein
LNGAVVKPLVSYIAVVNKSRCPVLLTRDLFECISAKGRAAMVYKRLNSAKG